VALFDSVPPGAYIRSYRKAIVDVTQRFGEGRVVETVREVAGAMYSRLADSLSLILERLPQPALRRRESVQGQAFRKMTASFEPMGKAYQLNALLVKATQKTFGIGARLRDDYGFRDIIRGRLDIVEIDADHRGLMDGVAASRLHDALSAFMAANEPESSKVVPLRPLVEAPRAIVNR
jgi:hypothetical protein